MRHLVRTEIGLVATLAVAMLVAYIGLAISVSGRERFVGLVVLVLGLWTMLYAAIVHDRQHRERGQLPHAVWGPGERRKPPWWNYW